MGGIWVSAPPSTWSGSSRTSRRTSGCRTAQRRELPLSVAAPPTLANGARPRLWVAPQRPEHRLDLLRRHLLTYVLLVGQHLGDCPSEGSRRGVLCLPDLLVRLKETASPMQKILAWRVVRELAVLRVVDRFVACALHHGAEGALHRGDISW